MRKNGQTSDNLDHFFVARDIEVNSFLMAARRFVKVFFSTERFCFLRRRKIHCRILPLFGSCRGMAIDGSKELNGRSFFSPQLIPWLQSKAEIFFGICGPQKKLFPRKDDLLVWFIFSPEWVASEDRRREREFLREVREKYRYVATNRQRATLQMEQREQRQERNSQEP